jgi:hypothetical protein
MRVNKHQLGLANIEERSSIGNAMFQLSNTLLWPSNGIVTRSTTCWTAEYANEPGVEEPFEFVVKDSWRLAQRESEAVLLRDCKEAGVKGIAEYIAHEESFDNLTVSEPDTVHPILGTPDSPLGDSNPGRPRSLALFAGSKFARSGGLDV